MSEVSTEIKVVRVGIAEGAVCSAPHHLRSTGLGSCVGVVLWDPSTRLSGLVHVMLPSAPEREVAVPQKYADTGVRWLLQRLLQQGGNRGRLRAKIAGGAQMFVSASKADVMRIGPRNVEAVLNELEACGVLLESHDVGGNVGRTVEFDSLTGMLQVRTATKGIYQI